MSALSADSVSESDDQTALGALFANDPKAMPAVFAPKDDFARRHLGLSDADARAMLATIEAKDIDTLMHEAVPQTIRTQEPLHLKGVDDAPARGESDWLAVLRAKAQGNKVQRSLLGLGYYGTLTPGVIARNILQNPGWYTQYTPYQAEISQGRLEALLNFQTMVADLCALPIANASLLDEASAAAEAMGMCLAAGKHKRKVFWISDAVHPQTEAVVRTRAEPLGVEIRTCVLHGAASKMPEFDKNTCGILLQTPGTDGLVHDPRDVIEAVHAAGGLAVVATDLLALTMLVPPGELDADIAVGSAQRLGVPLGFGGPHAGFLATKEKYKRQVPGRIIGVSKDRNGKQAFRMALQTREQHIRREKATSNICTAQALLAIMAGMYVVYHGPKGLRAIAERIGALRAWHEEVLSRLGFDVCKKMRWDTLQIDAPSPAERDAWIAAVCDAGFNLRAYKKRSIVIALDECSTLVEGGRWMAALAMAAQKPSPTPSLLEDAAALVAKRGMSDVATSNDEGMARTSDFLQHPVFLRYHTEHEMLRYMRTLESRDLSLCHSMIPLGSCTMKLNASSEMDPIAWPEWADMHPFAPAEQTAGYRSLFADLEDWIATITGFAAVSLQPNAGAQGEYTGLCVIRAHHRATGQTARDVCLIPVSAHGTNPASAVMVGMKVVVVACDAEGNVDLADLDAKLATYGDRLAALMITYPSTHGVFEEEIVSICERIHAHGGFVYMDGANLNAQVGLCRPGDMGADVCHLNLHKTFAIPHGGGGPGMGPIAVSKTLAPYLPGHPLQQTGGVQAMGPVSAAPWGSAGVLPISWMYMAMMGGMGLTEASKTAILSANYMATRLKDVFSVLYTGAKGRCAHEFILDLRPLKASSGIEAEDVAKRLMDYGYHAPTMSFPVAGTLMIEPTESESKVEMDRFCEAMLAIREEIAKVERGDWPQDDNPLVGAPHTASEVASSEWAHPYSRDEAAFALPWVRARKFWPSVARIDNVFGDRNLICSCPPIETFCDESV